MLQGCNSPIVSARVGFVKPKAEQHLPIRSIPLEEVDLIPCPVMEANYP
jgi:hypothetical protein